MKIPCAMAEDLMPLYLDGICSEDSRAALEEHVEGCQLCREKLARMDREVLEADRPLSVDDDTAGMALYARKVRRRRLIRAVGLPVLILVLAFVLSLVGQAWAILEHQRVAAVPTVEEGTVNLTEGRLTCPVEEIGDYILFTSSTQITVSVQNGGKFAGQVMLWDAAFPEEHIMICNIDDKNSTCVFSNLTAENRYVVRVAGVPQGTVTVGGTVGFLQALGMAWERMF